MVSTGSVAVLTLGESSRSIALVFTRAELVTLARAYQAHTGISLSALGDKASGNDRLFWRLFDGLDAYASSVERASDFFVGSWPRELPWPLAASKECDPVSD